MSVVSVHAMKAKGTGGKAPRIPNLSSTFGDYRHAAVAIGSAMLTGWVSQMICMFRRREKCFASARKRTTTPRMSSLLPSHCTNWDIILLQQYIINIVSSSISVISAIVCATWRILFIYLFTFFVFLDSPNSHLSPSLLLSVLFSSHFIPQYMHTIRISSDTTLFHASDYTAVLQFLVLTTHWRWHHRPTGSKDEPARHELH